MGSGAAVQLTTLFALGREVASVLDLDELLQKIPQLIARLTKFQAFAVYLLDPKRDELTIRANEIRLEKEIRFAQRVQAALLPTELPKRLKGADVAARRSSVSNALHGWRRLANRAAGRAAWFVCRVDVRGDDVRAQRERRHDGGRRQDHRLT